MKNVTLIVMACLVMSACTVTPKPAPARTVPTYSGNDLNSGIISIQYGPNHQFQGFVVDDNFVTRYNRFLTEYGYVLANPGSPLPTNTHLITAQQMVIWKDLEAQPGLGKKPQTVLQKIGL